jgi:hypothetical protein
MPRGADAPGNVLVPRRASGLAVRPLRCKEIGCRPGNQRSFTRSSRMALGNARWEFALVGKNLTNEHVNLGDNRALAAEVPGRPRLVVNQPETIGVEFRATF